VAAPPVMGAAVKPGAAVARPALARGTFEGLLQQADALREREKPEAALDLYGRAHELKPDRVEPLTGRGLALLDLGNATVAEAAFEQALQRNPRHGPAIMGLAEAARAQGHTARAIQQYQRYLEVSPDGPEAGVVRATLQRLQP
jgi:tetratricopeptide (TPR) repeat protein